ncbi:MAG: hypothetical protein ABSE54_03120 [Smithella sp.]
MKKQVLIMVVALLIICIYAQRALCDCTPADPYRDRAGWARWCACMGGHIEQQGGNPACAGVSGSGSSGSSSGDNNTANMNNAAYQLGTELHKVLFGDPEEKARQIQQQGQMLNSLDSMSRDRIRSEEEIRQKAEEKARQLDDQNRNETLLTLKPATSFFGISGNPNADITLPTGPTGSSVLNNDSKKFKDKAETVRKAWRKALGCAMEEVYTQAESLGPKGKQFAQNLREEMENAVNTEDQPVKVKDSVNIIELNRDITESTGSADGQYIVHVAVFNHSDGNINVDVQSSLSKLSGKNKQESFETDNIIYINEKGETIITDNTSAAVKACLKR